MSCKSTTLKPCSKGTHGGSHQLERGSFPTVYSPKRSSTFILCFLVSSCNCIWIKCSTATSQSENSKYPTVLKLLFKFQFLTLHGDDVACQKHLNVSEAHECSPCQSDQLLPSFKREWQPSPIPHTQCLTCIKDLCYIPWAATSLIGSPHHEQVGPGLLPPDTLP